jgi:hypothetical protein
VEGSDSRTPNDDSHDILHRRALHFHVYAMRLKWERVFPAIAALPYWAEARLITPTTIKAAPANRSGTAPSRSNRDPK